RKLMQKASYISLRTTDSAQHELVNDLHVNAGHCPAFDYLDTRKKQLSRLPQNDSTYINELLADTKDRIIVGINIRPIGHLYTTGADGGDVKAYTRMIEDRFEQRLANGMLAYHDQMNIKPCFIFFPMNAIQFGMSDILSAYRIKRHLSPEVDFRIWQSDASLDGVIEFLRHIEIAITMRFHATIFALSQQCKVIGIDYVIGQRDKVAELLDDVEQGENCTRIDLLTGSWLKERLEILGEQVSSPH
ncbi:MAG: polysaccharide pyruvyl transferase family protein, partial [Gammaproteobacteria bacterium]|nr:polysaccharide pyruvyl transferase family protein [Gammaproteobacteria bacterium]